MTLQYDKSRVNVLVVDDEDSIRTMLELHLKEEGWNVDTAKNGKEAFEKLKSQPVHIVISDINMPEMTGVELLEAARAHSAAIEVVIMTSHATLESAVTAVRLGAYDYLNKPFEDISVVSKKVEKVAEKILLRQQNQELLKRLQSAGQELKALLKAISPLTGILTLEDLQKISLECFHQIFPNLSAKASWWTHVEGQWKCAEAVGSDLSAAEPLEDIESVAERLSDYKNCQHKIFEHAGVSSDAFVYESHKDSLSSVWLNQLEVCYQKVMVHREIASLANKDGLTKLYNHRYFQERLKQELSQAKRQKSFVSLLLMDVDHFKNYNDSNGHPAGDKLLVELAKLLNQHGANPEGSSMKRETDIVARYGGEEFVMILPFTPNEGAKIKAERVLKAVSGYAFDFREKQPLGTVSLSMGIATFPDHAGTPADLIAVADRALYAAKKRGRNQAVGAEEVRQATADKVQEPAVEEVNVSVVEPKIESNSSIEPPPPPPTAPTNELESTTESDESTEAPRKTLGSLLDDSGERPTPSPQPSSKKAGEDVDIGALVAAIQSACDDAKVSEEVEVKSFGSPEELLKLTQSGSEKV